VASPFRTNAPPFEPRSGVDPVIRLRPDTVREPDPADRLPSAAAVKLRQLIAANEDAHAVRQAISDRRVELQAERGRLIVRRILRKHGYPPDMQEKATQTVLEQAALFSEVWAAAA
jgi:hypothetical protein